MTYGNSLIACFPYLEIAEPKFIRGEHLFPLSWLDKIRLSAEDREHIKKLSGLFYDSENSLITDLTWSVLPATTNNKRQFEFTNHLEEIHRILGYLSCVPDSRTDYFRLDYHYEQLDYFIFEKSPLNLWKGFLNCIRFDSISTEDDEYFDEVYEYSLNGGDKWSIVEGCRIYPQSRLIGRSFDLDELLSRIKHYLPSVNVLALFNLEILDAEQEDRIFNVLEWHNRSCLERSSSDMSLVSLAVAFETLLGTRQDSFTEKTTDRGSIGETLYNSIRLLVGDVPRLFDWSKQFYHARSRILHQGEWSQMRFSVTTDNSKSGNAISEYGYLTHYGWLIFRICLNSFLSGPLQVSRIDLKSKFFNNQERLERILNILFSKDSEPFEALMSVVEDIKALYNYPLDSFKPVNLETVWTVGNELLKTLLKIGDEFTIEQKNKLQEIKFATNSEHLINFETIIKHLILIMENTDELPAKEVKEPAIQQLSQQPPMSPEKIKENVQKILDDSRNKEISDNLRTRLSKVVALIDDSINCSKLEPFKEVAQSGNFITKFHLFSLIEGYGSFVREIINLTESNTWSYIVRNEHFLSQKGS